MAVPEFYYFIRPALEAVASKEGIYWQDVGAYCADYLKLTEADRRETIPGKERTRLQDRTHWALTYLRASQLVETVSRGHTRVTQTGKEYLARAPKVIKPANLEEFPSFIAFKRKSHPRKQRVDVEQQEGEATPREAISSAFEEIRLALAEELLERLKTVTPSRFETVIVQLMLKLGYGGLVDGAGITLGKSGDEGVDGVIKQDRLGLDNVYLQAKRWANGSVSRKEIQAFVGALSGKGASKGVFITTSDFTKEARTYAESLQTPRLSLINGIDLARMMTDVDLGVALEQRYDVKRIDSDFFEEA